MPDYGYYNWAFDRAFQLSLFPFILPKLRVTAKSSECPFDLFFRICLPGRSISLTTFDFSFDQSSDEKFPLSEDKFPLLQIFRNRSFFKFCVILNQHYNELFQVSFQVDKR